MGIAFALFQAIWNNFFSPNAWLKHVKDWMKDNSLPYSTSKTLANAVLSYASVAVAQTVVTIVPSNFVSADSEHFMIIGIRMYDGANAVLNQTNWALGISDALAKQGQMTIKNSGSDELFQFPLRMLIPATGDSGSGLFILTKPIYWKAQTNLQAAISFPTAPATANYNVALDLIGLKFI